MRERAAVERGRRALRALARLAFRFWKWRKQRRARDRELRREPFDRLTERQINDLTKFKDL